MLKNVFSLLFTAFSANGNGKWQIDFFSKPVIML